MSPMDLSRYPHNWKAISLRIRDRAGQRCECSGECGLHHERRCEEMNRTAAKWARGQIVLTVAHLDHDPMNCADDNLKAMCQRCHLRYDRPLHAENSAKTRDRKKGQTWLPGATP